MTKFVLEGVKKVVEEDTGIQNEIFLLMEEYFFFFYGDVSLKYELIKRTVFSSNLKNGKEGILQITKEISCTFQISLTRWYVFEKGNVHFRL